MASKPLRLASLKSQHHRRKDRHTKRACPAHPIYPLKMPAPSTLPASLLSASSFIRHLRKSQPVRPPWLESVRLLRAHQARRLCKKRISACSCGWYLVEMALEFRALPKYYSFANASINLACIASHGNSRKAFTFDFLSNSPFTAEEFDSWTQRAVSDRAALPTKALCLRKSSQIEDLASSTMSDALIDLILKRKRKLCVAKDTEGGESEKAVASKPALHHAAKKPRYVSSIPIEKKATSNSSFDPFSRRKCKPVLIHDSDSSSTRPPKPPTTGQASTDRQHSSGEATPRQSEDLFVAHEKLDLDL